MMTDIKHIQDRYDYMALRWEEIYQLGREDEEFAAGNQWTPDDIQARGNRITIVCDEINAYLNKVSNNMRMNKLGIVVTPRAYGADAKGAELTANAVRKIQYDSLAQDAFITASDNCIRRGYGFCRISLEYQDPTSFQQRIVFRRIANPDRILVDPDFQASNAQDMRDAFVLEEMDRSKYEKAFPGKALPTMELLQSVASSWVRPGDRVLVAEYWRVEETPDELLRIQIGDEEPTEVLASDLRAQRTITIQDDSLIQDSFVIGSILQRRKTFKKQVMQYLTNGVEILWKNRWPGKYIPIAAMFGKEMWLAGPRRMLQSLIRLARDPQRLLNYYRSSEAELVGLAPKAPFIGIKGQFTGNEETWAKANSEPQAFLEYNATTPATGQALLPPPSQNTFNPQIQALEVGAESARRGVMAAMGGDTLPTVAQRQNQKSGIALERIDEAQNVGFYHFQKAYRDMIAHAGRILVDLISVVYGFDGAEIPVMLPDETREIARVESAEIFAGEFEVTVQAGPTQDSERAEAMEFANQLTTPDLLAAAIGGNPKASKIAGLAVKLRQGGPILEEIADVLDPKPENGEQDPKVMLNQAMEQIQQYEQALKALNAHAEEIEAKLKEESAKNQTQLEIARMNNETKIFIAEMQLEIDRLRVRLEATKTAISAEQVEAERERSDPGEFQGN